VATPRWKPLVLALFLAHPLAAPPQQPAQDTTRRGEPAVGSIRGEVFDSLIGKRLEGAEVRVLGTALRATTDQRGQFRLDSVPAGRLVLLVDHPALDSAGLSDLPSRVAVAAGRTTRARLTVPSLRTLTAAACGGSPVPLGRDSGIVFGAVRDAESGARLAGARVAVSWLEVERPEGRLQVTRRVRDVATDSLGNYYACSVAQDVEFRVQAGAGPFESGVLELQVGDRRVLRHDLSVSREAPEEVVDTTPGLHTGRATLFGSVRSEGGPSLDHVLVSVQGAPSEAVTDAAGSFVLTDLPSGSQMFYARRIGFRFTRLSVELRNGDTTRVSLELAAVTILDTLRVTGAPWVRSELDELDRRLHGGSFGYVLTSEDLRPLQDLRSAFGNLPLLRVETVRGGYGYSLLSLRGARLCSVDIWIDGLRQDVEVLQTYRPQDVIAVEYYPRGGQAPLRYQPSSFSSCGADLPGVLLVWTRYLW
jgi:hypothetical protein